MIGFPLTVPQILRVMPNARDLVVEWIGPLEQAMAAFDISTPERVQMFLANVAHESGELRHLEENLHYSPERLLQVFKHRIQDLDTAVRYAQLGPEAIANHVYADRLGNGPETSGDGWTYRGRGPLGVTFRSNYMACSIAICGDADTLLKNPEFLALPEFGAGAAGWYWDLHDCNALADAGDFDGVCDQINLGRKTLAVGDSNGYADRYTYWQRAREV